MLPNPIPELIDLDREVEKAIYTDAPCAFERETKGQSFRRTELGFKGTD
jgi:hypothetical protein